MGHALDRVLRETLEALLDHLNAQDELVQNQIRNLQERIEFIEKGYRPRQQPQEVEVIAEKTKPLRVPSARVLMTVEALLEKVDVGMTLSTLAERLEATSSSASRAVNTVQEILPNLIEDGRAGHCRTLCIPIKSEARIRTWLNKQVVPKPVLKPVPKPDKGVAVLTASGDRFILTLPSGKVHSATRARDLKRKAKIWGYSLDDQVITAAAEKKAGRYLTVVRSP